MKMIRVEMEDVIAVLQLCKPYIIGMIMAVIIGVGIMIACRKMSKSRRFFVRGNAVAAMLLVIIVCANMICFGPMSTLIGLATGNGTISDATNEESAQVAEDIMEEGIVLLENEGMLPLSGTQKLNLFGWEAVNPAYGGVQAVSMICMKLSAWFRDFKMPVLPLTRSCLIFMAAMVRTNRRCQSRNRAGHFRNRRFLLTRRN